MGGGDTGRGGRGDGGVGWDIFYFKIFPRDGVPVPLGQARERRKKKIRGGGGVVENRRDVIVLLLGGD